MGSGVGKKLMNEGCRVIKEKGYGSITTDWRITNLASSTFWPKCGFKPVAYRMIRFIDTNYAWANFNNPSIKQL
jgi:ribosomal protein S18 acetylase RimI-like enzyme